MIIIIIDSYFGETFPYRFYYKGLSTSPLPGFTVVGYADDVTVFFAVN